MIVLKLVLKNSLKIKYSISLVEVDVEEDAKINLIMHSE